MRTIDFNNLPIPEHERPARMCRHFAQDIELICVREPRELRLDKIVKVMLAAFAQLKRLEAVPIPAASEGRMMDGSACPTCGGLTKDNQSLWLPIGGYTACCKCPDSWHGGATGEEREAETSARGDK